MLLSALWWMTSSRCRSVGVRATDSIPYVIIGMKTAKYTLSFHLWLMSLWDQIFDSACSPGFALLILACTSVNALPSALMIAPRYFALLTLLICVPCLKLMFCDAFTQELAFAKVEFEVGLFCDGLDEV